MGMTNAPFMSALNEVTALGDGELAPEFSEQPYFSPFGSSTARKHGYKGPKYVTNGASNTIQNWNQRPGSPFAIVAGTRPMEIRRIPDQDANSLRSFFVKSGGQGELPRIVDAAVWWLRRTDLEGFLTGMTPDGTVIQELFLNSFALTDTEIGALFTLLAYGDEFRFTETPASPAEYLSRRPAPEVAAGLGSMDGRLEQVSAFLVARGMSYQPWHLATFVSSVLSKPFVILAGISGTGKTRLAKLVGEATGAVVEVVPVRPDWTDSSDLIGYTRIDNQFVEGSLLSFCRQAISDPERQFFFVLDEMNIARVEYYLAEVLSLMEDRRRQADEQIVTGPLVPQAPGEWSAVYLPGNLCLVGSVNMDETTHGFSKKVLDRSFVIELSDIDLTRILRASSSPPVPANWGSDVWRQPYLSLADVPARASHPEVDRAIEVLEVANSHLELAQLQVAYRVRDEVALFCLNAQSCLSHFLDWDGNPVDPLDVALLTKVLPRIQGGGITLQRVIEGLLGLASNGVGLEASQIASGEAAFPLTAERLRTMAQRLEDTGFTSYWL